MYGIDGCQQKKKTIGIKFMHTRIHINPKFKHFIIIKIYYMYSTRMLYRIILLVTMYVCKRYRRVYNMQSWTRIINSLCWINCDKLYTLYVCRFAFDRNCFAKERKKKKTLGNVCAMHFDNFRLIYKKRNTDTNLSSLCIIYVWQTHLL